VGAAPAKKASAAAAPAVKVAKKAAKATKVAKKAVKATPATQAAKAAKAAKKAVKATPATPAVKAAKATKATKAVKAVGAVKAMKSTEVTTEAAAYLPADRDGHRPRIDPQMYEAIEEATAEALSPPEPVVAKAGKEGKPAGKEPRSESKGAKRRRGASMPPPAVNEPLEFITFVTTYPLGSEMDGEVASFTSHGAMVEVGTPDGGSLHCYVPLTGLGDPPPHKARQVLRRGEHRTFVLVSLDPLRRVAELALPGLQ